MDSIKLKDIYEVIHPGYYDALKHSRFCPDVIFFDLDFTFECHHDDEGISCEECWEKFFDRRIPKDAIRKLLD